LASARSLRRPLQGQAAQEQLDSEHEDSKSLRNLGIYLSSDSVTADSVVRTGGDGALGYTGIAADSVVRTGGDGALYDAKRSTFCGGQVLTAVCD
jgi:hypothetical protein